MATPQQFSAGIETSSVFLLSLNSPRLKSVITLDKLDHELGLPSLSVAGLLHSERFVIVAALLVFLAIWAVAKDRDLGEPLTPRGFYQGK